MASTLHELAESGEFLREFGEKHFCVIKEALAIDRILVSLVPIGNSGKDSADFYLTTTQMMQLVEEIRSKAFAKKIAADTGEFPSAYKFVTGENGDKRLNIGRGKKGVCVQVSENTKNRRYIMAVGMAAFEAMARNFEIFTGLRPVEPKSFFGGLRDAFNAGVEERKKFRQNLTKEDAVATNSGQGAEDAPAEPAQETFALQVKGEASEKNGFVLLPAICNGEAVTLMFRKDEAQRLSWFAKFLEKAAAEGAQIKIVGKQKDSYVLFDDVTR